MTKFVVIGITDDPKPFFPPEVLSVIKEGKLFSGGRRHHDIVAPLLPPGAQWIDITAPLDAVFEKYKSLIPSPSPKERGVYSSIPENINDKCNHSPLLGRGAGDEALIVFASGDPLFFGFANTIRHRLPDADIVLYPAFNSLQMLAHRLVMPYHDMRIVSLTGRPWPEFDRALIERVPKIGILTDREHTPAAIAQRMLDYGYTAYTMHVGEHLGHPTEERVTTLSLTEAARRDFTHPNCLILTRLSVQGGSPALTAATVPAGSPAGPATTPAGSPAGPATVPAGSPAGSPRPFGIPDSQFALLNGREKMITKMPIRLLTLQALDLPRRHVLWDIGACTGSVSIEARLLFPHLRVVAFEIRPECEAIIRENARRHGAPGIDLHIGDFCSVCCDIIATTATVPDAIFIGGHGGHLKEIMAKALRYLAPGGVIVMNSVKAPAVKTDSHQLWDEACRELGLQQAPPMRILLDDHHPIEILKAIKP